MCELPPASVVMTTPSAPSSPADRRCPLGRALLVGCALLVAAHEDDAGEAQRLPVLAVERADELIALEEPGRVPHGGPVVLAAGDRAVEHLGGIDRTRQACLAGRRAVDVLDVEGAEIGDLDQGRDRRQALLRRAELEALDLLRLASRVPRAISSATESVVWRARASISTWLAFARREREDDRRHVGERRERGARPAEIDDRLLLVERPLLAWEVEAREDDDAVEPVRPPLAGTPLAGKCGAPVGPDTGLDRVEHMGHAHG